MLVDDQVSGFVKNVMNNLPDLRVDHGVVDGTLLASMAVVGRCSVTSIDGVELALDVWLKVIDEVDTLDRGLTTFSILERRCLDTPLIELL